MRQSAEPCSCSWGRNPATGCNPRAPYVDRGASLPHPMSEPKAVKLKSIQSRARSQLISASGLPGGSAVKNPPANAGHAGSIPGSGRSPGGWHGNPLQYSCLENPYGQRSLEGYRPWGHTEWGMTEVTSQAHTCTHQYSCLGSPMNRGAWWDIVPEVTKESDMA